MKTELNLMQNVPSFLLNCEVAIPENRRMRNAFIVLILLIICSTNIVYGQWLTTGEVPQPPCPPDKPFRCVGIVSRNGVVISNTQVYSERDISGTSNSSGGIVTVVTCSRCLTSPAFNYTLQKVGIGTSSPHYSSMLDIIGKTRTTTLQITEGAEAGKVLMSDGLGNGQWTAFNPSPWTNLLGNYYLNNGIGIGTSANLNTYKLNVNGNSNFSGTTNIQDLNISGRTKIGGNVGIGVDIPQTKLHVSNGTIRSDWSIANAKWFSGQDGSGNELFSVKRTDNGAEINTWTGSISHLIFNPNGSVLIGQTTSRAVAGKYKLDVLGGVRANSIVVNTDGADFVFAKNYRLRPLSEVAAFIEANHHLPEIAPAAQMQAEGVSVGELQTQLLQKIEELTLYIIEQNKQFLQLKQENSLQSQKLTDQNTKIEAQAKRLDKLEKATK